MNTKKASTILLIAVFSFLVPKGVEALDRVLTVDGEGGAQYTHIQDAVDDAAEGDTILVHPYTYNENITIKHRELTVRSVGGPALTEIDGNGSGRAVTISRCGKRRCPCFASRSVPVPYDSSGSVSASCANTARSSSRFSPVSRKSVSEKSG